MDISKFSKFISQIGFVYAANGINGVLGLISIPFVMITMGSQNYGIYSIFLVITSYVTLMTSGISRYFVRELSSGGDKVKLLQTAIAVYISISLFLLLVLPVFANLILPHLFPVPSKFQSDLQWISLLAIIDFTISIPILVSQIHTVSDQDFKKYSYFISVDGLLRYSLLLVGTWIYHDVLIVVSCIVGRRVIELLLINRLLNVPMKNAMHPQFNILEMNAVLKKSFAISISQFFKAIMLSMGAILVNRYHGIAVLGNYRAAFDISSKVWFFSNGLSTILLPKFSKMLSEINDRELLQMKMSRWIELSWFGYLLIGAMSIYFAARGLALIKLTDSQIIIFFQILIVGTCLNAHSNLAYEFIIADRRYKIAASISILSTLTLYFLFYILHGKTSLFSAAWAWIVSQFIYSILTERYVLRELYSTKYGLKKEIRKMNYFLVVMILLGISNGFITFIDFNLFFLISLVVGGYLLLSGIKDNPAKKK